MAFGGVRGRGRYSGSDFSSGTLCGGPGEGCGWVRVGLGVVGYLLEEHLK